ncbi:MAG: substrate-binding domain-containing protein [Deferribacteraceae bacterium]|jgi:phosphate transport system substrate-binding protein|nr:substrate-binding domain-containing protein [Deferribacteraceae bacterium]
MKKVLIISLLLGIAAISHAFSGAISVVSRESGSGTRGAFIELTGVEERTDTGRKDQTTKDAIITNKTDVMLSTVAGNPNSIGYISLGSLNSNVKALKVDGVAASVVNIKNGTYALKRPFNLAYKGNASAGGVDFISYILSKQGSEVISKGGYIPISESAPDFTSKKPSGRLVVAGSSSVSPIMEKLVEAYGKLNPSLKIEVQTSDSSTGLNNAINGTCDIGMSSRDLKSSELGKLNNVTIAIDGLAVIVNKKNDTETLTVSEIKDIFTGKKTKW